MIAAIPASPTRPLAIMVAAGMAAPGLEDDGAAAELAPEAAAPPADVADEAAAPPADEALEATDDTSLDADPAAELAAELALPAAELAPLSTELAPLEAAEAPEEAAEVTEPPAPAKMVELPTIEVKVEPSEVIVETMSEVVIADAEDPAPSVPVVEADSLPEPDVLPDSEEAGPPLVKAEVAGRALDAEPELTSGLSVTETVSDYRMISTYQHLRNMKLRTR